MKFPKDFLFGTANADHQVEAHDPTCEDVWDLWEQCQGLTPRGKATDFWNRYEEDVQAAANMGCRLFRFSVAWSRVEPRDGEFDPQALAHYRRLAECIRDHGMKVMLTLHHFVWPIWLERDRGGMLGQDFPDLFARYADRLANELGDLVDFWISFNEPSQLTFGYIKPWWQSRYYMPPGLPAGSDVDAEAEAVGKLVPNLFRAHARARTAIRIRNPNARVGANPLVTGFPTWLQMLMDWAACHRGLSEAVFKFTTSSPLVSEKGDVDLVLGGVTADNETRFEYSDPYVQTGKAILVLCDSALTELSELTGKMVGVIAIGNQPISWKRDLPANVQIRLYSDYTSAQHALVSRDIVAVYGDEFFLTPCDPAIASNFRFLITGLSQEPYVAVASHGHGRLLALVNRVIADSQSEQTENPKKERKQRPVSLHELWAGSINSSEGLGEGRDIRRIRKNGILRVGIRKDSPGRSIGADGIEVMLARRIATSIFGEDERLEIVDLEPVERLKVLSSKSRWLNWAWRFWGTTSLIANSNWWYLGMAGKLQKELCPDEAIGAQDFVGLDYYWGLPTWKLHKFRSLEDAAHGRFLHAPVWPRGLFHALRRLHRWFPEQDLMIVENGSVPVASGISRKEYLQLHLAEVLDAIRHDVPVTAYNCWSITSNREWGHAFDPNTDFGLYFVNLDKDPELQRQASTEVSYYQNVIRTGELDSSQSRPRP